MPENWVQIKDVVWKNGKPWAISVIKYEPLAGASEWKDISMQEYLCAEWSASFPNAVEHKPVSTITGEKSATPAPVSGDAIAWIDQSGRIVSRHKNYGGGFVDDNSRAIPDSWTPLFAAAKTAAPGFTREEIYKAVEGEYQSRNFVMNDTDKANAWLVIKALIDMGVVRVKT